MSGSSIQHIDNARIFRSHGEMLLNVRNSKARQLEANVKGSQGAKRDQRYEEKYICSAPLSLSCFRRLPGYKIMLCENCQYPQLNSFPNSFLWKDYRKITIQEEFQNCTSTLFSNLSILVKPCESDHQKLTFSIVQIVLCVCVFCVFIL